jgi:HK97 family phage major capsid protein
MFGSDKLQVDAVELNSVAASAANLERSASVIVRGTGAGQPLGILNSPALISQDAEAGQLAATIVADNIIKMWSRLLASSRANSVWYCNQDVEPQLMSMFLAAGTGGVPVYLPANGLSGTPYGTLMSRPVIPVEYAPTVGDLGDIVLADGPPRLGVVVEAGRAVFVGTHGLTHAPLTSCITAWRIG